MGLLKSMTGFGEAKQVDEDEFIYVAVKSVNNKNLVVNVSLLPGLRSIETRIIATVKEHVHRGTLNVYLNFSSSTVEQGHLILNKSILEEYHKILQEIGKEFNLEKNDISISDIVAFPGIVDYMDMDTDTQKIWRKIEPVLNTALQRLDESRVEEGNALREDLVNNLGELEDKISEIERCSSSVVEVYRKKIKDMVESMTKDIDFNSERLEEEITMAAIKADVHEELVRLKHHMNTARELLGEGGPVGKKLDFVLQEMHRESNTLGVKSPDPYVSGLAIDAKLLINKMKEQVLNVE
ncbi:MAG: YicC family protein [Thermotogae bacterium]|nr:YicC family protein [Thermotogota bacterium]